uniref:Uncharacterized protein n=1 Tax=Salmonella phage vB_SE130_2P TaxID=3236707 RepID=A0AB39C4W0_9VIRU
MALQPYKGAMTAQFYVLDTMLGVTPIIRCGSRSATLAAFRP